jgi:hypothetical protein
MLAVGVAAIPGVMASARSWKPGGSAGDEEKGNRLA